MHDGSATNGRELTTQFMKAEQKRKNMNRSATLVATANRNGELRRQRRSMRYQNEFWKRLEQFGRHGISVGKQKLAVIVQP